jgi:hypothetical protein
MQQAEDADTKASDDLLARTPRTTKAVDAVLQEDLTCFHPAKVPWDLSPLIVQSQRCLFHLQTGATVMLAQL